MIYKLCLLLFLAISSSAFADYGSELLTYQQLMSLSAADRALYIRETRQLLLDVEHLQTAQETTLQNSSAAPIVAK